MSAKVLIGILLVAVATMSCGDTNAAIERIAEARHLSADLYLQFAQASASSDRAVMADTEQASAAFAKEAEEATQALQHDVDALAPLLQTLGYDDETRYFQAFVARFATYRELDRRILDLAVQNTNLKAQRLSFGPVQQAADAAQAALESLAPARPEDAWQVKAMAATVVADIRQIQALQAPHIADANDSVMTRLEARMRVSEADVHRALASLGPLVTTGSKRRLADAEAAVDRLMATNVQIIDLSRQNTNVRSLALALDQKRTLTAPCEESLRNLRDALAKRGRVPRRWP